MNLTEIFSLPVCSTYLLYAPLHHLAAVVNRSALKEIKESIQQGSTPSKTIDKIFSYLTGSHDPFPQARQGDLVEPYFLGILPTRDCNMACRYCDFLNNDERVMSLDTARMAVDAYLDLLHQRRKTSGAVHFFGGEPFHAPQVVQFVVEYARLRAKQMSIQLHFEVTTNGNYDEQLGKWISSNIDTVVLSFDGFPDTQNYHRPQRNGKPSYERVAANARLFSSGDCELILRTCVSNRNVEDLPQIADWLRKTFLPAVVCFEPLTATNNARRHQLHSPDPLTYARRFCEAAVLLEEYNIPAILSSADLSQNRVTPCPVGNDALIVSPEGTVNACYLLEKQWQEAGLDMQLGNLTAKGFHIRTEAIDRMRQFSVYNKPLCTDCFCRYHCAGGCHVSHHTARPAGEYDDLCIRTRLVSAALLLDRLGQHQLREDWLNDDSHALLTALQTTDRLSMQEIS